MYMIDTDWAEALARDLLEEPLPDRWAHSPELAHLGQFRKGGAL